MAFGSGDQALERGWYGHMVKMYEISENLLLYINNYLNYEIYDPGLGIQAL